MKIRSAITILVAIAWLSTQMAMGFAHGTMAHDHKGVAEQTKLSQEVKHHVGADHRVTADKVLHSHFKKQIDISSDFSAHQACDASCTAISINSWVPGIMDRHITRGAFAPDKNQELIELPTPPPDFPL